MAALKGKWRIVEMELGDKDFLDMMGPAYIAFDGKAGGEFAFGCVTAGLHCRKTPSGVDFTWEGNDEMDQASGDGWAEREKDGSLEGEIRFHNGDGSTFKARLRGVPASAGDKMRIAGQEQSYRQPLSRRSVSNCLRRCTRTDTK